MQTPRPFSVRLVAWFVALAIGPAAILAVIAYLRLIEHQEERVLAHLTTAAGSRARAIAGCLDEARANARTLAPLGGAGYAVRPAGAPGVAALRAGKILHEGDHLVVGAPRDDGGADTALLHAERVFGYLRHVDGLADSGETILVDDDGAAVGGRRPGGAGADVLAAERPVGNWRVVARTGRAEALAPVRSLAWRLGTLGGVFFLVVAGAIYYFGRRTERSVEAMVESVQRAARGEFGGAVSAPAFAGLKRVTRAINEMHEKLGRRDAEIRKQRQELFCQRCELERLNSEIVQADKMKSEFVANMSHEVRTPLHSILTLAGVLLRETSGPLTEEQAKQVGIVERNGRALLAMIGDILDFSKIEAGRMNVTPTDVVPGAVAAGVREIVSAQARAKGLRLELDVADALPALRTDAEKLHRVLLNLAGNAVKFTDQGRVTLRVHAAEGGGIAFVVEDTGPGIPPDQIEHVFEPFHQGDGSRTRPSGGTGLGLSIARSLTELLGGRLGVQSRPGEGTRFELALPARGPVRVTAGARPAGASDVLVVGETIPSADAVRAEIQAAGFHAGRAVCGRDVRGALDRDVGAILLDIGVFAATGVDLLNPLAPDLASRDVPILGYWVDEERRRGGFCGVLTFAPADGGYRLDAERAPPLPLPSAIGEDERARAAAWTANVKRGGEPFHTVVRQVVARLDEVLAGRPAPVQDDALEVLLLDPDHDALYSMALQVDSMGYRVRPCSDLGSVPRDARPALIVTETILADTDDAVAALVGRFDAPVVVLTADARPETAARARAAGAASVMTKPVAAATLLRTLEGVRAEVEA